MHEGISIQGAKTNNLKNISVSIPKGQITVVTGLSGSGKSSLVFDTLAAESQRLLNETYSSYIQQILPHYEEPDVERIQNLPVSIVINQKKVGGKCPFNSWNDDRYLYWTKTPFFKACTTFYWLFYGVFF
ncbi:ATP-binding cassette domain-containing protein [Listeria aquatica]|uniref:ATP-binding cassette domain-containing protein n=1 Tax=Listeria aquatica TaxID=1494960 RepID=UPI0004BCC336